MLVIHSSNQLKIDLIFMATLDSPLLIVNIKRMTPTRLAITDTKTWFVEIFNASIFSKNCIEITSNCKKNAMDIIPELPKNLVVIMDNELFIKA